MGANPNPEELERFMAAVRLHESSNNYLNESDPNPGGKGTAKGAYQFIDATWANFGGVANALLASPEVQDSAARELMSRYYRKYGSWELVGIAWHAGEGSANDVRDGKADSSNMSDMYDTITSEHVQRYLTTAGLNGSGRWNGNVMSSENEDNWVILKDKLDDYGLGDLYDFAYDMIMTGQPTASVLIQLRDQPAYKERFKGLEERVANGYGPMSEMDYLDLEREYLSLFEHAQLPREVFGEPEDLAAYIANNVAPDELEWRIGMAMSATESANPEVKVQLEELYGIGGTNSDLIAYYLNPERAVTYFEGKQQIDAARLSAASVDALGEGLSQNIAERLVEQNVQAREISERLGGRSSLTQNMLGSQGLSGSEFAAAEFGQDSESVAQLSKTQQARQQAGKRRSGAMATQQGVTGLGSAS